MGVLVNVIGWSPDYAQCTVHRPVHTYAYSEKGYSFEGMMPALRATVTIEVGLEASSSFVTKGEL
jgi:hypothetical protein